MTCGPPPLPCPWHVPRRLYPNVAPVDWNTPVAEGSPKTWAEVRSELEPKSRKLTSSQVEDCIGRLFELEKKKDEARERARVTRVEGTRFQARKLTAGQLEAHLERCVRCVRWGGSMEPALPLPPPRVYYTVPHQPLWNPPSPPPPQRRTPGVLHGTPSAFMEHPLPPSPTALHIGCATWYPTSLYGTAPSPHPPQHCTSGVLHGTPSAFVEHPLPPIPHSAAHRVYYMVPHQPLWNSPHITGQRITPTQRMSLPLPPCSIPHSQRPCALLHPAVLASAVLHPAVLHGRWMCSVPLVPRVPLTNSAPVWRWGVPDQLLPPPPP